MSSEIPRYEGTSTQGLNEWLQIYTPLVFFGNDALHIPTTPIDERLFNSSELEDAASGLLATHHTIREGIGACTGLAHNQIGGNLSLATVWTRGMESPLLLANPRIIKAVGAAAFQESCMSDIGNTGQVVRPLSVTVEYEDLKGDTFTSSDMQLEPANDRRFSRVVQHEIDHLHGKTCDMAFIPGSGLTVMELAQFGKEPFSAGIVPLAE